MDKKDREVGDVVAHIVVHERNKRSSERLRGGRHDRLHHLPTTMTGMINKKHITSATTQQRHQFIQFEHSVSENYGYCTINHLVSTRYERRRVAPYFKSNSQLCRSETEINYFILNSRVSRNEN